LTAGDLKTASASFSVINDGKLLDFAVSASKLQKGEWINVEFINGETVKAVQGSDDNFTGVRLSSIPEWVI